MALKRISPGKRTVLRSSSFSYASTGSAGKRDLSLSRLRARDESRPEGSTRANGDNQNSLIHPNYLEGEGGAGTPNSMFSIFSIKEKIELLMEFQVTPLPHFLVSPRCSANVPKNPECIPTPKGHFEFTTLN